jgi:hypothetical protein
VLAGASGFQSEVGGVIWGRLGKASIGGEILGGPGQSPDAEPATNLCGFLVARGRVQLPTFALGVRCSMHLSYRATWGTGGTRREGRDARE